MHFRTKYDEYTYEAIDVPTQGLNTKASLFLDFDTKSTGNGAIGTEGLYVLQLVPQSGGWYESPKNIDGLAFSHHFKRGQDYDWRGFVGPSPLDPSDHVQFEFKVRTSILTQNAKTNSDGNKQINYYVSVVNANGIAQLSSGNGIPMIFKDQPLLEFDSEASELLAVLLGTVAAVRLGGRKRYSRRDFIQSCFALNERGKK